MLSVPTSLLLALVSASCDAFSTISINHRRHDSNTALSAQSIAEKVLANPQWPEAWPYSDQDFARQDESADSEFYDQPRLCYHIDDAAVTALTEYYSTCFKDGEDVLDLCSSWVSHYPKDWKGGENVVGLGMNEYELSQNPVLTSYEVKDLNEDPTLPFEDNTFDKVTCVVSIDYLNKPLKVCQEIARVLRPGGECILSMSNRCFPTKAFQIWLQTSDLEHIFIAGSFFHYAGGFDPPSSLDISPNPGRSDPLYIVKAAKKQES
mmetsp:Transcript_7742/g.16164  ORF Transcript_7742/g.16164 Transcript_7742/m.16164 type:complete len:264 (-) Transcript_7742:1016-1807(-)